jgi:hypothetical protein
MRLMALFVAIAALSISSAAASKARAKPAQTPVAQAQHATTNDADVEAMRADLAHMRVLVGQMQRNLGFVDSGLTPLKHQFELEIEMWNTLINDMQRRLNARTEPAQKPAPPSQ